MSTATTGAGIQDRPRVSKSQRDDIIRRRGELLTAYAEIDGHIRDEDLAFQRDRRWRLLNAPPPQRRDLAPWQRLRAAVEWFESVMAEIGPRTRKAMHAARRQLLLDGLAALQAQPLYPMAVGWALSARNRDRIREYPKGIGNGDLDKFIARILAALTVAEASLARRRAWVTLVRVGAGVSEIPEFEAEDSSRRAGWMVAGCGWVLFLKRQRLLRTLHELSGHPLFTVAAQLALSERDLDRVRNAGRTSNGDLEEFTASLQAALPAAEALAVWLAAANVLMQAHEALLQAWAELELKPR